jgi:hypothetical protein
MTDPAEPCKDCGKHIQVLWCPLWDTWLCVFCRANHTEQDISASRKKWASSPQPTLVEKVQPA